MKSTEQLETASDEIVVIGELGLTGDVRAVEGVLPTAHRMAEQQHILLLLGANAEEASLCRHGHRLLTSSLLETVRVLSPVVRRVDRATPMQVSDCPQSTVNPRTRDDEPVDEPCDASNDATIASTKRSIEGPSEKILTTRI